MKITRPSYLLMIVMVFVLAGCGSNKELKNDAKDIADVMCKNIEIMNRVHAANPADSVQVAKLQQEAEQIQIEMTIVYQEFKTKNKNKLTDDKFNKDFAQELRKAMLKCPHLSKEDREAFEKELK